MNHWLINLVALEDIDEDEDLFSISRSDILSVQNSSLLQHIPCELDNLDPWMSLILTMIYEAGQCMRSKWWPYLSILPSKFDTLMYWSPEELAELQGSSVLQKIGKGDAESAFTEYLLPIVKRHANLFGEFAEAFSGSSAKEALIKLAHRMGTLIMAYAFDLIEEEDEEEKEEDDDDKFLSMADLPKGMIPLADILNADGDLNNVSLTRPCVRNLTG